jgi:ferrous iron transport protein B
MIQKEYTEITKKIDKFITKSNFVMPLFLLLLFLIFETTFSLWNILADLLDSLFNYLYGLTGINNIFINSVFGWFLWLVVYFPNIIILYFFLFLLKDSGLLPRISYVFDKSLNKIWLSWNWFISLFMWFGCTIPAILSTKTIENKKEKILTIMMLPFISCSAKLPVFVLFVSIFVPENMQSYILMAIYLLWVLLWILSTYVLWKLIKHKKQKLIINLPNYNFPKFKKIIKEVFSMLADFIIKVWIYVIPFSIILSLAFIYPHWEKIENTYWWRVGNYIQVVFEPLWFNKEMSISAISGLVAKEITVSTLGALYYIQDWDTKWLINKIRNDGSVNMFSAISFLIFILLYTPCIWAIFAAKRELWNKWWIFFFFYPLIFAWIFSFLVYRWLLYLF